MAVHSYSQPSSSSRSTSATICPRGLAYGGSSSRSSSSMIYPRRPAQVWGIPDRCYCGRYVVLKTSRTYLNPGRRFYGCEESEDGKFHVFKWWEDAMMDEFGGLRHAVDELRYTSMDSSPKKYCLLESKTEMMGRSILEVESEIADLKMLVVEKKDGVVWKKTAIVVGLIVTVLIVLYFLSRWEAYVLDIN